jgi:hypothetical protein
MLQAFWALETGYAAQAGYWYFARYTLFCHVFELKAGGLKML